MMKAPRVNSAREGQRVSRVNSASAAAGQARPRRAEAVTRAPSGHRAGESHPRAKVADELVCEIRRRREQDGVGYRRLAKETGLPLSTIRDFCTYRTRVLA